MTSYTLTLPTWTVWMLLVLVSMSLVVSIVHLVFRVRLRFGAGLLDPCLVRVMAGLQERYDELKCHRDNLFSRSSQLCDAINDAVEALRIRPEFDCNGCHACVKCELETVLYGSVAVEPPDNVPGDEWKRGE